MTAPVMNSLNQPMMPNLPIVPDNNMVNSAAPVIPNNPAVPAYPNIPNVSAIPTTPAVPATPIENNIPSQDTFVNNAGQTPAAPSAASIAPAEDVWSKEINPGIPAGHAESDPNNAALMQNLAAAQLQQQPKSHKLRNVIIAGSLAALAGVAYIKRRELPQFPAVEKYFKNLKLDKNPLKFLQDRGSVTSYEKLEQYSKEFISNTNSKIRHIKIHKQNLGEEQEMTGILDHVLKIASDTTTMDLKGKKVVIHVDMDPKYQDEAPKIRDLLNLKRVSDLGKKDRKLIDTAVQKIELKLEPEKMMDKFLGRNKVAIDVGYTRVVDEKIAWYNKFFNFFDNTIPDKAPTSK